MVKETELVLDKRTEEILLRNKINLWVWYEAAKCIRAKRVEQLYALADKLGIEMTRDVEKALVEGFDEYNWDKS